MARTTVSRRRVVLGTMAAGIAGAVFAVRGRLCAMTQLASFAAPPPLVPHDPVRDRATICVAQGASPAANIDTVLDKIGGISTVVEVDDLAIVAGRDPVAIDAWVVRNVMAATPSANRTTHFDLDDPDAKFTRFARYYRQIRGAGTLDPALITIT